MSDYACNRRVIGAPCAFHTLPLPSVKWTHKQKLLYQQEETIYLKSRITSKGTKYIPASFCARKDKAGLLICNYMFIQHHMTTTVVSLYCEVEPTVIQRLWLWLLSCWLEIRCLHLLVLHWTAAQTAFSVSPAHVGFRSRNIGLVKNLNCLFSKLL